MQKGFIQPVISIETKKKTVKKNQNFDFFEDDNFCYQKSFEVVA